MVTEREQNKLSYEKLVLKINEMQEANSKLQESVKEQ